MLGGKISFFALQIKLAQCLGSNQLLCFADHARSSPQNKRKPCPFSGQGLPSLLLCRHFPIFPGRLQPSIFSTIELNFCVRDGYRWFLDVFSTDSFSGYISSNIPSKLNYNCSFSNVESQNCGQALDLLVHPCSTPHSASTWCLSTS